MNAGQYLMGGLVYQVKDIPKRLDQLRWEASYYEEMLLMLMVGDPFRKRVVGMLNKVRTCIEELEAML